MKIILNKTVAGLGKAGDIKEVNGGYARNFLLPKGLADVVTKHSLRVLENRKAKFKRVEEQTKKAKLRLIKNIDGKTFIIDVKADEKGSLYSKIDKKTIARELLNQGIEVKTETIQLEKAIKKVGEYKIGLKSDDVAGEIILIIKK